MGYCVSERREIQWIHLQQSETEEKTYKSMDIYRHCHQIKHFSPISTKSLENCSEAPKENMRKEVQNFERGKIENFTPIFSACSIRRISSSRSAS